MPRPQLLWPVVPGPGASDVAADTSDFRTHSLRAIVINLQSPQSTLTLPNFLPSTSTVLSPPLYLSFLSLLQPSPTMTTDESTQTNGVPGKKEPQAGLLTRKESMEHQWTVESGM
jgi:hypothetical protein